jgi:hypothetical protein
VRVDDAEFPASPGVYVVRDGGERPLYVGKAATQTIAARWREQHLRPRAGGSALRRTLGVELGLVETKLKTSEGRYYPAPVEQAITDYLLDCTIEFHPTADADAARTLEAQLIAALEPRLNVRGVRRPSVERCAQAALTRGLKALRGDVLLDEKGYVVDVRDNLLPTITLEEIEAEFAAGAGDELRSKMRAPWSSSALAVNAFAPWRRDLERLTIARKSGFQTLAFERRCNHGVRGESPHLDVLLERPGHVVGVESKCLEYTRTHPKAEVADAYWALGTRGDKRAMSRWFTALRSVGEFVHLDAYQLVKHYLGLAYSFPESERTLVYLFWEPMSDESLFAAHRAEVARFADLVDGDTSCRFVALSYTDHWAELEGRRGKPLWLDDHLARLRSRYAASP